MSSSVGYIYVTDWDRYQHYKTRRPPWIKFYLDLLGNDEWLTLSPSDVKLLCVVWMLAGNHGNGRVRADQGWLNAQANTPRGSLERLSDAGFVTVRASKAASSGASRSSTTETETETETETDIPLTPVNGGNGFHPDTTKPLTRKQRHQHEAEQKRLKAVIACRRVWRNAEDDGENMAAVRESLERDYRHDPSIVLEAIGAE